MQAVDLYDYNNSGYESGHFIKKLVWYFTNAFIFNTFLPFPSIFKVRLLQLFGAQMGVGVVIQPKVNIKFCKLAIIVGLVKRYGLIIWQTLLWAIMLFCLKVLIC